ncbi:methyl-accepting chemotaxis protein [Stutzerimonas azotifigens]|uniref:PAS domain S-box protein n=1 Tax=Stutzerimonas azotifigens TaxID=291995 RepID=A0ABR5Z2U6_9GAMM|nr:methyl-accepting chemotaxis protein [Stutzerimonas azotifigens]MBA1274529.1 PAS domain S-box protein [Stutzerimonas azotifigens]
MTAAANALTFVEPPISRLDPQGVVLNCNPAYRSMCGYSEAELVGKPHQIINHPDMPAVVIAGMWRALRAGVPWTGPMMGLHKDGSTYWHTLYVVPLFDGGQLSALGTVYQDIEPEDVQRAQALYLRLARGKLPWSWSARVQAGVAEHALTIATAIGLIGAWASHQLGPVWLIALLALLGSGTLQSTLRRRKQVRELLARHREIYSDALLAPLHSDHPGDIGRLAMALNSQRARMSTVMSRICINSEVLRQQAQSSAEVVDMAAEQLGQQVRETEQTAAAINEMSATIQELSRNLQTTAEAAQKADQLARDGERLSVGSQASMTSMRDSVKDTGVAVEQLAEAIESIGGIANVIQNIAEQTNLLALNAAIEAARAGESGRGFAVVADEVRRLASHTRESTHEIQSSIESLRDGSARALATAQNGEAAAQRSAEDVEQARQALARICEEIGQISGMSLQMAAAIEQQGQVAEQINRQITDIAGFTERTSQQAGRTTEISQAVHQLAESQLGLALRFLKG